MRGVFVVVALAGAACAPDVVEQPPVVVGEGGRWELLTPLPSTRQEQAVVAFEGEVVMIGGFDETTVVANVDAYDPVSSTWRALPALPVPLHHANAATAGGENGERIVVGGFLLGADFRDDPRTFVFDGVTWSAGPAHPVGEGRGASGVCALDGAVYVFGGTTAGGSSALASRYLVDDDVWESLPSLPRPLDHLGCGAFDGAVWIVAGREDGITNHVGTLLRYVPSTRAYEERAAMPTSRGGAAVTVVGDALYVVGGEGNVDNDSGVFAAAERYRFAEDRWEAVVDMRTPRHGLGAATVDGALYTPGGATVQAFGAVDVNERFVPDP